MKYQNVANYVAGAGAVVSAVTGNVPGLIASGIAYASSAISDDLEQAEKDREAKERDNKYDRLQAECNAYGDPVMWD